MDEFNNPSGNDRDEGENLETKEPDNSNYKPEKPLQKTPVSPITAAFIGLIGGFLLYQVLGGGLTLLIFGDDIEHAPPNSLRLIIIAGQLLFILLPALLFSKWFFVDVGKMVRAKIPTLTEILLFFLGIVVLIFLLQSYAYIQNHFIEVGALKYSSIKKAKDLFDSLSDMNEKTIGGLLITKNIFDGLLVILVVSVVPAICEETMFRGFIQKSFEFRIKPFWAALITAIFFGLYHINPYGTIPLIALGFYFGYAAYMSNSIIIPIILHFFNNFIAVILYFIIGKEDLMDSSADPKFDLNSSVSIFVFFLLIFAGILIMIKRYYSRTNTGNAGINSVNL